MFFDPVSAGVSFGVGLIQNAVSFKQKQEAAQLQNEQIAAQYKQKLRIQRQQIIRDEAAYNFKKQRYNTTLRNLSETAQSAYQQEDLRLNEIFKQARFARQAENIALQQKLGSTAARNVTGKSAARMQAMDMGAYGRNQAIRAEQLFASQTASELRRDKIQRELDANRKSAYADVAFAPVRPIQPLEPEFVQGPSGMDFFGSLLGTAGSAFSSGVAQGTANQQLKARNPLTS